MSFGFGVGDFMAVSTLAATVYMAYKDAPINYKHIAEEVKSLQGLIDKAAQHFEGTTLSHADHQHGQEALKGCQSVLEDLNAFIEEYKSIASNNKRLVFKRVKLGTEDIATLRARLTSNATLLSSFIRSCEFLEIQAQLTDILGLRRTNSRVSVVSIATCVENNNTRRAYKQFCENLYKIGITEDTITQKEEEILAILGSQSVVPSSQPGGSSNEGHHQGQLLGAEGSSSSAKAKHSLRLSGLNWFRSRFSMGRPMNSQQVGLEAASSIPAAAVTQSTQASTGLPSTDSPPYLEASSLVSSTAEVQGTVSTDTPIRDNNAAESSKETALLKAAIQPQLLHLAAQNGQTDIVEQLLDKGIPIETRNHYNNTPLHLAAGEGHSGTVELLLRKGAPIESKGNHGNTPLHQAAQNGKCGIVELLLEQGALIKARNNSNNTPLHLAAWEGHSGAVGLLLRKGAPIELWGDHGHTPLHQAAQNGKSGTVEFLLEQGALIGTRNNYNNTPLHLAAWDGHSGTVELLLRKGAPIESMGNYDNTPLHQAAQNGKSGTVELLLEKGALIEARTNQNNTPLHLAARGGHTSTVELLLRKGASIESMGNQNNTPLRQAAQAGHSATVGLLLEKGASN